MNRTPVALTAGAAAIAAAAVIAASGSAQGPAPTSLHLAAADQKGVGFLPRHKPGQGDRFGFGATVTGDDTGIDRGVCTFIGKGGTLCEITFNLSRGTLTTQGLVVSGRPNKTPFAITGGTGDYDGARGTAIVTVVQDRTTTDFQVALRS